VQQRPARGGGARAATSSGKALRQPGAADATQRSRDGGACGIEDSTPAQTSNSQAQLLVPPQALTTAICVAFTAVLKLSGCQQSTPTGAAPTSCLLTAHLLTSQLTDSREFTWTRLSVSNGGHWQPTRQPVQCKGVWAAVHSLVPFASTVQRGLGSSVLPTWDQCAHT
jgi:hypothetical protein